MNTRQYSTYLFILVLTLLPLFITISCERYTPSPLPNSTEWNPVFAFPIGALKINLADTLGFDPQLLDIDTLSDLPYWEVIGEQLGKIPMEGQILFDFENAIGSTDVIDSVVLRVNMYNGFPIEIAVQAYLENAIGEVIDSLFNPTLILPRAAEPYTQFDSTGHALRDVVFNKERINNLSDAKKITFKGEIDTVIYFSQYNINIQLGAIVGISSDLNW